MQWRNIALIGLTAIAICNTAGCIEAEGGGVEGWGGGIKWSLEWVRRVRGTNTCLQTLLAFLIIPSLTVVEECCFF